ncbi:MAG: DUF2029 domain-containing protein [Planctomycetes bacterium]|nr:DUF2029 domain-containing protein [Planctomycetota bacterium]
MTETPGNATGRWPYISPQVEDPAARRKVRALRAAAYAALAAALITPIVQFQVSTMRTLRKVARFDREHPDWTPAVGRARHLVRPRADKGAIGRWRKAVRQFWAGRNIYRRPPLDYSAAESRPVSSAASPADYGRTYMHPNMPLVLVLLTPFAYMPVWAMALSFNVLKLLALIAAVGMSARLAAHRERRVVDWVVLLGLLWSLTFIVGDVRHGNMNVFVLLLLTAHLWFYRRGRDVSAGAALAAAVCIKLTPALFLLYWLYQRNWRLLGAAVVFLAVLAVIVPAGALCAADGSIGAGVHHYAVLAGTWLDNMILPGLVKGSWYPEHINQSLSGVVSRYFLAGRDGDIYWGPDDDPYYQGRQHGWITLLALSPAAARWLLRAGQAVIVLLMAWSIGWRRLPRDDGRRALHYGLVLLGMMLLNQRTWDHHAAVLLPAGVAMWQAIAYGRMGRRARVAALGLAVAGGLAGWLDRAELFKAVARLAGLHGADREAFAHVARAWGPTFYCFVLLLAAMVILSAALRNRSEPYAASRQKLTG